MKSVDTNVLVRYLVADDPKQSPKAIAFIEQFASQEVPLFINDIILCELVWVLESIYEYTRSTIAGVLEKILRTKQFYIHRADIVWLALEEYKKGTADFADSYIANLNYVKDCDYTVTFDKKAAKLKHMKLLSV